MSKFATVLMLSLYVSFLGRCEIAITAQSIVRSTGAAAAYGNAPVSIQDLEKPASAEQVPSPYSLVIDVDSKAEIGGVVRCVFQDSRGVLWVGGEGDLFRNDGKTVTSYDIKDDLGNGVTIKQIIEDHAGHIWCATTGGITRIEGKSFTSFGEKDGLLSRSVWSIAADKDSLWIGTIEGVCRFDGQDFTEFSIPESMPDPTRGVTSAKIVHCIVVDRIGRVWFGTNGGAYIYDGKVLANLSSKDGLPDDVVHNILEDKKGNFWIGTTHNGISRYDGAVFTNFTADNLVEGDEIWCIAEDSAGNVWFSGKQFGVYKYNGTKFTHFGESDGLDSPGLMSIVADTQGRVWLGGVNGLFRYDGNLFVKVTKNGPWN